MSRESDARKKDEYEQVYSRLRKDLAQTGYLWVGTVLRRYQECGKPACRCHRGGKLRHGPYYVWTRKVRGKTVTGMLDDAEGALYFAWTNNRKRLAKTLKKMHTLSQRLAPLALRQAERP